MSIPIPKYGFKRKDDDDFEVDTPPEPSLPKVPNSKVQYEIASINIKNRCEMIRRRLDMMSSIVDVLGSGWNELKSLDDKKVLQMFEDIRDGAEVIDRQAVSMLYSYKYLKYNSGVANTL